jgi:hypothetical protein
MAWKKIIKENDWGYLKYRIPGWAVADPMKVFGHLTKHRVRFPDGHEEVLLVEHRRHVEHVCDMGHDYTVSSTKLLLQCALHTLPVDIPIESVKIWIPEKK